MTIKEYFKNTFRSVEIKKLDFIELLNKKFERKFDETDARKALTILKQKLGSLNTTSLQVMTPYDYEKTGRLTLRNFKFAVNSIKALSQY